jgi:pimeloyl-ACP methyl ester carboxylesterase
MTARLFGPSTRPLFGVYHAPSGPTAKTVGVVLCYPGPQEYRQAHFVYRKLALSLAADGFHVLRFDYFGTGDSSGDSSEVSVAQWVRDIETAVAELRDISGVRRVSLVGMRLGAALALRAAASLPVAQLVLWDPVVSGADYLRQLDALQRRILEDTHYPEDDRRHPEELLGYVMPRALRGELERVDLLEGPYGSSAVTVICAEARPEYAKLHEALQAGGVTCALQHHDDPTLAGNLKAHDTLLPNRIPTAIRETLARRKA